MHAHRTPSREASPSHQRRDYKSLRAAPVEANFDVCVRQNAQRVAPMRTAAAFELHFRVTFCGSWVHPRHKSGRNAPSFCAGSPAQAFCSVSPPRKPSPQNFFPFHFFASDCYDYSASAPHLSHRSRPAQIHNDPPALLNCRKLHIPRRITRWLRQKRSAS
jgi:hypothetical protein